MLRKLVPLTVIVPTRNEHRNIKDCLASAAFAADRVVFDSYSDDDTTQLAKEAGARVIQRHFDVFSTHKNWAIDHIDTPYEWVMFLDADERIPADLSEEIAAIVTGESDADGYYVARQNLFAGKWIRHGGMYPDWQLRLFRKGKARYEDRIVHEHMLVDGASGFLKNHLIHHDYKGIERYFERHNHYTSLEAVEIIRAERASAKGDTIGASLWARGPRRRRAIKQFAYRYAPGRALLVFIYMYLFRLGFLDGRIGFRYCLIRAFHEYQISLKLLELRQAGSPIHTKYRHYLER